MSESKQEVFEDALAALEEYGEPGSSWETAYEDLKARYAAAGMVAVPLHVGQYIDSQKKDGHTVFMALVRANNGPVPKGATAWVFTHPDQFTEAWNHDWYAEEDDA